MTCLSTGGLWISRKLTHIFTTYFKTFFICQIKYSNNHPLLENYNSSSDSSIYRHKKTTYSSKMSLILKRIQNKWIFIFILKLTSLYLLIHLFSVMAEQIKVYFDSHWFFSGPEKQKSYNSNGMISSKRKLTHYWLTCHLDPNWEIKLPHLTRIIKDIIQSIFTRADMMNSFMNEKYNTP